MFCKQNILKNNLDKCAYYNKMPRFNVLYTVELDDKDKNKTDTRLIILYDANEETYYYYGTRSRTLGFSLLEQDKYIEFSGAYPESKVVSFISFFKYLNDFFKGKFNIELHNIEISEMEYDILTFEKIFNKFSRFTELFAYDDASDTEGSFLEKLDMLTTNIV